MILVLLKNKEYDVLPHHWDKTPWKIGQNTNGCFLFDSQIKLIFFRKLIPMPEKYNHVRYFICFFEYVSSNWALCPTLAYIFHYVTQLIQFQRPEIEYFVP